MFNVRIAGGHRYGKQLITWLSLVVSFMASFVLSFFPLDVLDGIWDLIESVSEGFLTYSCIVELLCLCCVEILKNHPVHSFNALIIPILRDCLPNYFLVFLSFDRGWSGGAMVLGKLPVPGRPTILITVGQGPIALAVGAGGGGLDIFTLIYPFSSFSLSLGDGSI